MIISARLLKGGYFCATEDSFYSHYSWAERIWFIKVIYKCSLRGKITEFLSFTETMALKAWSQMGSLR